MPDVYSVITQTDATTVERLGDVLELRAADDRQKALRNAYLSLLRLPEDAWVLDVGCGNRTDQPGHHANSPGRPV